MTLLQHRGQFWNVGWVVVRMVICRAFSNLQRSKWHLELINIIPKEMACIQGSILPLDGN